MQQRHVIIEESGTTMIPRLPPPRKVTVGAGVAAAGTGPLQGLWAAAPGEGFALRSANDLILRFKSFH